MNILQVIKQFPTQEVCIKHLESVRWSSKPVCPYCQSDKTSKHKYGHQCQKCQKSFSVTVGTIFHDTKIPLQTWFLAIAMFMDAKKGISAKQIERNLDISYPTAWRMLHQIRKAMGSSEQQLFTGILEMDETYVGGKPRKNKDDDNLPRGRATKKTPVVGIVDRDSKKVHAEVAHPNHNNQRLTGKQLLTILEKVAENGFVMTDEFKGYNILDHDLRFFRQVINHSFEYTKGDIHTNSIESFWAILKRGVYGIYHHVSVKHLQAYVNEFVFRYNNRENGFNALLACCV